MKSMFLDSTAFNQKLCWSFNESVDLTTIFNGSGGSFICFLKPPKDKAELQSAISAWIGDLTAAPANKYGPINSWDTSSLVTDMSRLFQGSSFNDGISNWNTASVTTMNRMFDQANAFNQDLYSWNTGAVTTMRSMFSQARSFNQDLSSWNTASVTTTRFMFWEAKTMQTSILLEFKGRGGGWIKLKCSMAVVVDRLAALNQMTGQNLRVLLLAAWIANAGAAAIKYGPIDSWDTSLVTDMSTLFQGSSFNDDISNWNTASVTDMSAMFYQASSFNGDLSKWNTAAVTNMASMLFSGAGRFNRELSEWNTAAVTNMQFMFLKASTFNQYISEWNVEAVTDMQYMFYSAIAFN
jgi:surface protein